ncbi:MAG: hypothetical protein U5M53_13750 [Rhodoferax sp.]|nr:hypothetical protein [Rhodoferax sp.]
MAAPPIPSMTGGAGGSAGPSSATAGAYGSGLNSSGWNVNFSGLQAAASSSDPGTSIGGIPQWILLAGVAVAGVVLWRFKSSKR